MNVLNGPRMVHRTFSLFGRINFIIQRNFHIFAQTSNCTGTKRYLWVLFKRKE